MSQEATKWGQLSPTYHRVLSLQILMHKNGELQKRIILFEMDPLGTLQASKKTSTEDAFCEFLQSNFCFEEGWHNYLHFLYRAPNHNRWSVIWQVIIFIWTFQTLYPTVLLAEIEVTKIQSHRRILLV